MTASHPPDLQQGPLTFDPSGAWRGDIRPSAKSIASLYVHIPFCATKCPYCDFNSHAGREREIDPYRIALEAELRGWSPLMECETLFVGGGTPTHGTESQLEAYLRALCKYMPLKDGGEWTVEINPGSLTPAKARLLVDFGVTRASVGAQSFKKETLKVLGRAHSPSDTSKCVDMLRSAGMPAVSLDLILAVPGQSVADQAADLKHIVALDPDHVSAYVLTYEPSTRFHEWAKSGRLPGPDADRELVHLDLACAHLAASGFERYEISNFARTGRACQHNLAYWRLDDWIGVGAGAHSHVRGTRWKLADDPAEYSRAIVASSLPIDFSETVSAHVQVFERLMMGLRLTQDGVDLRRVQARTGIDVIELHGETIDRLSQRGWITLNEHKLRATETGLTLLNSLLTEFITHDV